MRSRRELVIGVTVVLIVISIVISVVIAVLSSGPVPAGGTAMRSWPASPTASASPSVTAPPPVVIASPDLLGAARLSPTNVNGPVNILLAGVDRRPDQTDDSVRTDSIILLHIPQSHDGAVLVSIPRDTRVKIPAYPKSGFKGRTAKINSAFQSGYQAAGTETEKRARGMELLALTIKQTWGIAFDGAAIIDFTGFETVLGQLGGVTMCVEAQAEAIHLALDKDGKVVEVWYDDSAKKIRGIPPGGRKLIYQPGCYHMDPAVALEYARLRKGSCCPAGDYDRQRHQHQMIKAILDEISSTKMLKDPTRLVQVLQSAGESFTLDLGSIRAEDYLAMFTNLASGNVTSVRTNAGRIFTLRGSSDEALTPQTLEMLAALKNDTIGAWLAQHPSFVVPHP
ncbi:LCP family protein [Rhizocola hellebori]|nr:LCP family protein [Rhizocola hellebori]